MTSPYATFPVHETIDIREMADIRNAVDRLVKAYAEQSNEAGFSYRILLPRGEKLTGRSRRLGLSLQGEFVLGLRKKNLVPRVREIRYLHDEAHYGWLLVSPGVLDSFEKKP
jgi:hypothetical protein